MTVDVARPEKYHLHDSDRNWRGKNVTEEKNNGDDKEKKRLRRTTTIGCDRERVREKKKKRATFSPPRGRGNGKTSRPVDHVPRSTPSTHQCATHTVALFFWRRRRSSVTSAYLQPTYMQRSALVSSRVSLSFRPFTVFFRFL